MAIGLDQKKAIVAEVSEIAADAFSLVIADSRGVTVSEITGLRKMARENAVRLRVVRNSLAQRAFKGTDFECVAEALTADKHDKTMSGQCRIRLITVFLCLFCLFGLRTITLTIV